MWAGGDEAAAAVGVGSWPSLPTTQEDHRRRRIKPSVGGGCCCELHGVKELTDDKKALGQSERNSVGASCYTNIRVTLREIEVK